ncbi:MAG: 50S ribosomal protein L7/L12 [Chloroflexi bacterium]|nr:50S ribosomal protein L7/L12 [Chloroflexota bacterium]
MADLEKLYEELSALTLLEAAELKKLLEERWGVSAAAPIAFAGMVPGAAGAQEEVEEQTEFNVVLKDHGAKKIQVIKAVRALTSLGLKEAKGVVEDVPSIILEAVSKEAAAEAKATLEAEGAVVEIK